MEPAKLDSNLGNHESKYMFPPCVRYFIKAMEQWLACTWPSYFHLGRSNGMGFAELKYM
jgi:hypothetical protein